MKFILSARYGWLYTTAATAAYSHLIQINTLDKRKWFWARGSSIVCVFVRACHCRHCHFCRFLFYWFVSNKVSQAKRLLARTASAHFVRLNEIFTHKKPQNFVPMYCVMDFDFLFFFCSPHSVGAGAAVDGCFCVCPRDLIKRKKQIHERFCTGYKQCIQLYRSLCSGRWCILRARDLLRYCFYFEPRSCYITYGGLDIYSHRHRWTNRAAITYCTNAKLDRHKNRQRAIPPSWRRATEKIKH